MADSLEQKGNRRSDFASLRKLLASKTACCAGVPAMHHDVLRHSCHFSFHIILALSGTPSQLGRTVGF